MKKLLIIILFFSTSAKAQIIVADYSVEMQANGKSVRESFGILKIAVPSSMWFYDRYVIKDGITYYRPGFSFIRKNKAFIVKGGDLIKVSI